MKKRHFFHLGILCLILTVITSASPAFGAVAMEETYFDNSGVTVTIQGLTSDPIEVSFPEEREGSEITVSIYSSSGELLFEMAPTEPTIDLSSLNLLEGEKSLLIEVGNSSSTFVFD